MSTQIFVIISSCLAMLGSLRPAVGQTQTDMTNSACGRFKKADLEMNRVYRQIMSKESGDTAFVTSLREAQRAWVRFRDAHIKSVYPDPDPRAYGSANSMCRCGILEQLTVQRSSELRQRWIDGTEEGDVCTGSSPAKSAPTPNRRQE